MYNAIMCFDTYRLKFTLKKNRKTVSDIVKRAYLGYFGVRICDQVKKWALVTTSGL